MKESSQLLKERLMNTELTWCKAIEHNDVDEISAYMTDDWRIIGTEGITTKDVFLESVKQKSLVHTKMDFTILDAIVLGETGVIVAKGTSAGTYMAKPFSFYEWSLTVFTMIDGRWTAALTMLTAAKDI